MSTAGSAAVLWAYAKHRDAASFRVGAKLHGFREAHRPRHVDGAWPQASLLAAAMKKRRHPVARPAREHHRIMAAVDVFRSLPLEAFLDPVGGEIAANPFVERIEQERAVADRAEPRETEQPVDRDQHQIVVAPAHHGRRDRQQIERCLGFLGLFVAQLHGARQGSSLTACDRDRRRPELEHRFGLTGLD